MGQGRCGEAQEARDVDGLGPGVGIDAGRLAQGLAAERLQAGAQHLAALAEGGGGDALQRGQQVAGGGASARGVSATTAESTLGGGVKARAGSVMASRASLMAWASTDSRP